MEKRTTQIRSIWFVVVALVIIQAERAHAQAWVADEMTLSTSFDYNFARSDGIVETPDLVIDNEPVVNHNFVLGAEFTPLPNFAVSATVPFSMIKYEGDGMLFPRHGRFDDGDFHSTLRDLRAGVRYQVIEEALALSPHLGVTIPMTDYETIGYAGAGRGLKQLHVGASIGRTLRPYAPSLYLHAQYEFTLSEKYDETPETEEIGQNRSDASVQVGYVFLDGKLDVNLGANFRFAHGGIHFIDFQDLSPELQMFHDPLLHEEFILIGGGVGYYITERLQLASIVRLFVRGSNTRNAHIFGLGVAWEVL